MSQFRGYYNYLIPLLRLALFAGSALMLGKIVWLLICDLPSNDQKAFELAFGAVGMGGLFMVFAHIAISSQLSQMYNITVRNGSLTLIHVVTFRKTHVTANDVRGYTTTIFHSKLKDYPCIILHLKDGRTFEFPQFLFFNFRHMGRALDTAGIKYLGEQSLSRRKWFRKRQHKLSR